MVPMNSPAELMAVLQRRNLAEVRNYLVREYLANNPQHLDEVRDLISSVRGLDQRVSSARSNMIRNLLTRGLSSRQDSTLDFGLNLFSVRAPFN